MNKRMKSIMLTLIGLFVLCTGSYLNKKGMVSNGSLHLLTYFGVGLGCGIFGRGMSDIFHVIAFKNHPEEEKKTEIEINDERNIAITNHAKAKAYDMMIFVFGALMFTFAMMEIDLGILLLFVVTYLFVSGYGIYYRCKLNKEM